MIPGKLKYVYIRAELDEKPLTYGTYPGHGQQSILKFYWAESMLPSYNAHLIFQWPISVNRAGYWCIKTVECFQSDNCSTYTTHIAPTTY